MQNLTCRILLSLLCFNIAPLALAQRMPEPQMDHEPFDRIDVELLIKQLEAAKFSDREKAEQELKKMLTASGYPLWHFLFKVDVQGRGLAETRLRLRRILKVLEPEVAEEYLVKDWEGNPLPNVFCEVYTMTRLNYGFDKEHAELLGRTTSDDKGIVRVPDLRAMNEAFPGPRPEPAKGDPIPALGLIVYAPGYGTAGVELRRIKSEVSLPLAKSGSRPCLRSARGVVVDEQGRPIEGVAIKLRNVNVDGVAFTDHKGRYRVYGRPYGRKNKLVPVGEKFHLQFSDAEHFPHAVYSSNTAPQKIALQRGKSFHRFEIDDDMARKSERLPYIFYESDNPPRSRVALPESYVKDGGLLLPGTYTAEFHDTRGYQAKYAPVVVDAASPELLTFEFPSAKTFTGIVYDGITGEPASDAIVFAGGRHKHGHFVDITDQQLADLAAAPVEQIKDHPTVAALNSLLDIKSITKTDKEGKYSATLGPTDEVGEFYMMAPGMLPYNVRAMPADKAKQGESPVVLNDMFQFASARVQFTARPPKGTKKRVLLVPDWQIDDKDDQPEWFAKFQHAEKARSGVRGFSASFYWWRNAGGKQTVAVPADVRMKLMVRSNSRAGISPVLFADELRLSPGEVKDMGQVELKRNVPVQVRIVDQDGNAVEGVLVRYKYDAAWVWHIGGTTNLKGEVEVGVAAGLPGEFGARNILGPDGQRLEGENLKVPFEIDAANAKRYTIQLTKEQAAVLPKEGAE